MSAYLEHSARVAHARTVLAGTERTPRDYTEACLMRHQARHALEQLLAASGGDVVLVSRTDLRMAVVGGCTKHQQDAAIGRLRAALEGQVSP